MLERLGAGLEKHDADMIAPKIMFHGAQRKMWYAGGHFSIWRGYSGVHDGMNEVDMGQFDRPRPVEYSPTCCLLIKRGVFHKIGIMDELYFIYWDDTDFCFRARNNEIKLFFSPDVRVFHKVSSLMGGGQSKSSIFFGTRNHVYFLLKNIGVLRSAVLLVAYQCVLLSRFIGRSYGVDSVRLVEKAFVAGIRLFVYSRNKGELRLSV